MSVTATRNIKKDDYNIELILKNSPCSITFQNQWMEEILKVNLNIGDILKIPEKSKMAIFQYDNNLIPPKFFLQGTDEVIVSGVKEENIPEECLEGNHVSGRLRTGRTLSDGTFMGCCYSCLPYREVANTSSKTNFFN